MDGIEPIDTRVARQRAEPVTPARKASARARALGAAPGGMQAADRHGATDGSRGETAQPGALPMPSERVTLAMRAVEIPIALAALVLSLPVMLALAWIIRRDSPGPALFFQTRLGRGGKPFRFVKFRTYYVDARERFPELYDYRYTPGEIAKLQFKVDQDPRATRVGRWLRRTSFDELPNFWNVLTGDMALVGPRPEIPEMLPYYTGEMLLKFTVRPGITGLAQTSGRGRLGFLETAALDVDYVQRKSLWTDVKLLLKTIRMVALRDGAF